MKNAIFIVFIILFFGSFLFYDFLYSEEKYCIKTDRYVLKCGIYKGDNSNFLNIPKNIIVGNGSIKINNDTYYVKVSGDSLLASGKELFKVFSDNKFLYMVGSSVEYKYEG